jgi:hypothetical protein
MLTGIFILILFGLASICIIGIIKGANDYNEEDHEE